MKKISLMASLGLIAACVGRAPVENRSCPCSDGYTCCDKTNLCLPEGVTCACPASTHEGGDGACVPNGTCSPGYHDGGDGSCLPAGQCITGYRDGGGGACVPTGTCDTGYHDGGDGNCLPVGVCITGLHDDGAGKCVASGCASGCYLDAAGACKQLIGGLWKPLGVAKPTGGPMFCSDDGTRMGGYIAASTIEISNDSGVTWRDWRKGSSSSSAAFSADGQHILATRGNAAWCDAASAQSLFISHDFGETWTELPDHLSWAYVSMTQDGSRMTASICPDGVEMAVSADTGQTWHKVTGTALNTHFVVSSQRGNWLANTSPDDDSGINVSGDWGETWATRHAPADIKRGIGFVGPEGRLLALGENSTFASDDGGVTWSGDLGWTCDQPPRASLDGTVLACMHGDSLLVSRDAGQSWTTRGSGATLQALSPSGSLALGTAAGSALVIADLR